MEPNQLVPEEKLDTPVNFPFPFEPYIIQKHFMEELYVALEERKLGIFESPTGTGKSLSIICGAFRWLIDHEERKRRQLDLAISAFEAKTKLDTNSRDWFNQQSANRALISQREQLKLQRAEITQIDCRLENVKTRNMKAIARVFASQLGGSNAYKKSAGLSKQETSDSCEDFIPDDFLIHWDDVENPDADVGEKEESVAQCTKIIFCSRTHSQLTQFAGEIKRSPYRDTIRVICLASRQSYCINDAVRSLGSLSLMNERCLDLRDKKGKGCKYLQAQALECLSDEALLKVLDIEDLGARGRELSACPYYSSRKAVQDAQVLLVPYNTLLHKETREAWGIELAGNVVIIDEAHNLLDTIANVHSAAVTGQQLTHAYSQLTQYRTRYEEFFKQGASLHIQQLVFTIGKLILMLGAQKCSSSPTEPSKIPHGTTLFELVHFVYAAEIDNLNLYKIMKFCKESQIAEKLQGFAEYYHSDVNANSTVKPQQEKGMRAFLEGLSTPGTSQATEDREAAPVGNNPMRALVNFLGCLTLPYDDGRIVCTIEDTVGKCQLKFILLNPAMQFSTIIQEARSVIVAGGTMKPMEEFQQQLYLAAGANLDRICTFSCGHVVPPENILAVAVVNGPSGCPLDFTYKCRTTMLMMDEIGRIIRNVCNVVPAGVVCFFPSYEYANLVFAHLEKNGLLDMIKARKKVFREPKKSSDVEHVLAQYARSCNNFAGDNLGGALLFSVIGGKLSEGLNFNDDLGRCVVVVGMPYPNSESVELNSKMKYLDTYVKPGAGQEHYENLCMKAINQSIGRAVRHKDDYSTVLLLDQRYAHSRVQMALPDWIRESLSTSQNFGKTLSQLCKFFLARKKN